jgi:hypothetical protein
MFAVKRANELGRDPQDPTRERRVGEDVEASFDAFSQIIDART